MPKTTPITLHESDGNVRLSIKPVNAEVMVIRHNPAKKSADEIWIIFDDGLEVELTRSPGFPEGVIARGWSNEECVCSMHLTPVTSTEDGS